MDLPFWKHPVTAIEGLRDFFIRFNCAFHTKYKNMMMGFDLQSLQILCEKLFQSAFLQEYSIQMAVIIILPS